MELTNKKIKKKLAELKDQAKKSGSSSPVSTPEHGRERRGSVDPGTTSASEEEKMRMG